MKIPAYVPTDSVFMSVFAYVMHARTCVHELAVFMSVYAYVMHARTCVHELAILSDSVFMICVCVCVMHA